jgi:predicted metal-dependent phosphoesterase TrpH
MGLADLHMHTIYSYDGTATVPAVLRRAHEIGLDVIAITDHDEIAGSQKALELASHFGVEVIPGIEITTAEGDLLALFVKEKIQAGLSLVDTILNVRELNGICIVPHPLAGGMGMKSLSGYALLKALRNPDVVETLIGIETYNATSLDRMGNQYARILSNRLNITQVGNSDAHVLQAIGLGATEFEGKSAEDLLIALKNGTTKIRKGKEWSAFRVLGSWGIHYLGSAFERIGLAA